MCAHVWISVSVPISIASKPNQADLEAEQQCHVQAALFSESVYHSIVADCVQESLLSCETSSVEPMT